MLRAGPSPDAALSLTGIAWHHVSAYLNFTLASRNAPYLPFTKFYAVLTFLLQDTGNFNSIAAHPLISIQLLSISAWGPDRSNWGQVTKKTMLAWIRTSADKTSSESHPLAAGFLYRLTVAFPSWAGAILAVYSIFLCRFSALKIRLK